MTPATSSPGEILAGLLDARPDEGGLSAWSLTDFVVAAGIAAAQLYAVSGPGAGAACLIADSLAEWSSKMERQAHRMIKRKRPTEAAHQEIRSIVAKLEGWIATFNEDGGNQ